MTPMESAVGTICIPTSAYPRVSIVVVVSSRSASIVRAVMAVPAESRRPIPYWNFEPSGCARTVETTNTAINAIKRFLIVLAPLTIRADGGGTIACNRVRLVNHLVGENTEPTDVDEAEQFVIRTGKNEMRFLVGRIAEGIVPDHLNLIGIDVPRASAIRDGGVA